MSRPVIPRERDPFLFRQVARRRVTPRLLEACQRGTLTLDQAAELHGRLVVPPECRGPRGHVLRPATREAIATAQHAGVAATRGNHGSYLARSLPDADGGG
jgi:hypothetical protein